jgi:hypothetical protein
MFCVSLIHLPGELLWVVAPADVLSVRGAVPATIDVVSEPRLSGELGSNYVVSIQVSLYFNAKNLSNTPLTFAEGNSQWVIQRELYRQTYPVAANLSF